MNKIKKAFNNCLKFFNNYFSLPKFFLSVHFGFITSWLANDYLTPRFFNLLFSERNLLIKFGIVLIYTCFFSVGFYFVISQFELFFPKIVMLIQPFFDRKIISALGQLFFRIKEMFHKKWFKLFLILGLSIMISFYIFGENLNAQWWIIDDHEFMAFLGHDGRLDLKEIPAKLLSDTEVGGFGGKPRYRPSYYFLRLLETSLWGNNPQYYYFLRLMICSFFIFALWLILKDIIGFVGGFIFILAVMSFNYWAEVFSRLGPAETYAVFGISLFCLGLFRYFKQNKSKNSTLSWFCVFLGAVIAIGSKENMVLLAIPILWMLVDSILRKQLTISQSFFSVITLLFCALVVVAVFTGISNRGGHDIYATDISVTSISTLLINEIRTLPFSIIKYYSLTVLMIAISYAIIVFGLSIIIIFQKNKTKQTKNNVRKILIQCVVYMGCVYLIFLSQRVFYAQGWPTGLRYDFPGKLAEMFTLIILITACLKLFKEMNTNKLLIPIFICGYYIFFVVIIIQNNYFFESKEYARNNAQRTTLFTQHINQIKDEVASHPEYPIIFQSYDVLDYEPVFSTKYFFQTYQVPNKVMVNINGYTSQSFPENSLGFSLASKLEQTNVNGGWVGFSPSSSIADLNGECYSLDFSRESNSICIDLGRIW